MGAFIGYHSRKSVCPFFCVEKGRIRWDPKELERNNWKNLREGLSFEKEVSLDLSSCVSPTGNDKHSTPDPLSGVVRVVGEVIPNGTYNIRSLKSSESVRKDKQT